ncbi:MAG TPA: DUF6325 family protein [Nocardioides sp.]|uniref:DUF6325 family protein n=1 Tax=Nocardioides sp. TaxID=35761 RepID=UPI002BC58BF1|nr:DUF6325 family protein [Nocardioides sp.]HQR26578.1 DUF6325 family protein [Nocardioides sp.]
MTAATPDVHGPIDFLLIEFENENLTGEAGPALLDLVERGIVRLYDLLVVRKHEGGAVETVELSDPELAGGFSYFAAASSGLIGDEDVREAAEAMREGTTAALIVYENSWAIPFVAAARNSGGEVIASARIPATDVMAALDALDATTN